MTDGDVIIPAVVMSPLSSETGQMRRFLAVQKFTRLRNIC